MKEYKSSVNRLMGIFQQSRENWKQKALVKQKKLRALQIKVRYLSTSRERWKTRAKEAEKQLSQLQVTREQKGQKKGKMTHGGKT